MPIPPNLPWVTALSLLILVLVHVVGVRVEPAQHALQGIVDQLLPLDRRDIVFLDLADHVLDQPEIAGVAGRGAGARTGAVAAAECQHAENGGGPDERAGWLARWGGHHGFPVQVAAECRSAALRFQGEDFEGAPQGRAETCSRTGRWETSISLASLFAIASAKELKSWTTIRNELVPPITFCR